MDEKERQCATVSWSLGATLKNHGASRLRVARERPKSRRRSNQPCGAPDGSFARGFFGSVAPRALTSIVPPDIILYYCGYGHPSNSFTTPDTKRTKGQGPGMVNVLLARHPQQLVHDLRIKGPGARDGERTFGCQPSDSFTTSGD